MRTCSQLHVRLQLARMLTHGAFARRCRVVDAGQSIAAILDTANSWPSTCGSTLQPVEFVGLESMPFSMLRCATWLFVCGTWCAV